MCEVFGASDKIIIDWLYSESDASNRMQTDIKDGKKQRLLSKQIELIVIIHLPIFLSASKTSDKKTLTSWNWFA